MTIEHMLMECAVVQRSRVGSLGTLFKTIPEAGTVEFRSEAGFFLSDMDGHISRTTPKSATKWQDSKSELTPATLWNSVICLWSLSSYERTLPVKDGWYVLKGMCRR